MASWQHLHAESKLLPVAEHLKLLGSQFLASTLRQNHPSHNVVSSPAGPRRMKQTQNSKLRSDIDHLLVDSVLPAAAYTPTLINIHTKYEL